MFSEEEVDNAPGWKYESSGLVAVPKGWRDHMTALVIELRNELAMASALDVLRLQEIEALKEELDSLRAHKESQ